MKAQGPFFNPINRSRLHEEIVSQIQSKIIKGELKEGDKLPSERELAASVNVNRATVREALKKLEILGLVTIQHGDGIYVRNYLENGNLELLKTIIYLDNEINPKILQNLLSIRTIISPKMAGLAAQNRSEKDLKDFETKVLSNNNDTVLEKDLSAHHIIGRASGNLFYIFILNFFRQIFKDFGFLYFNDDSNKRVSQKFHRDIFEALKSKNSKEAEKIMKDVLTYTEETIYKNLKE